MRTHQYVRKKRAAQSSCNSVPRPSKVQSSVQPPAIQAKSNEEGLAEHAERLRKFQRLGTSMIQMGPPRLENDESSPLHPKPWLQRKLTLGQPGDKYEREADRIASQVVQTINPPASKENIIRQSIQRENDLEGVMSAKGFQAAIQRKQAIAGGEASSDLESDINKARGSGQPLNAGLQQSMGQAMRADFSGVRVHTDTQSDQLNQSIQAQAFTTGQDVFFRQGAYQPENQAGQELIAHELTHVIQQNSGAVRRQRQFRKNDELLHGQFEANVKPMQLQPNGQSTDLQKVTPEQRKGRLEDLNNIDLSDVQVLQQRQGRINPIMQTHYPAAEGEAKFIEAKTDLIQGFTPSDRPFLKTSPDMVQMDRKEKVDLLNLTVGEFETHRKAEQMDWANVKKFTKKERNTIWQIIDWRLNGLDPFILKDVVDKGKNSIKNLRNMKAYCDGLNGELNGEKTVRLAPQTTLEKAIYYGHWLQKIHGLLGKRTELVVPTNVFTQLVDTDSGKVAEAFIKYFNEMNPNLQTPSGKEITCFIKLVHEEKAKIGDYKNVLKDIRNFHKFPKESLDKLKADLSVKDKPLTLILHSLYDHNGAFIRHEHVNKVIKNDKIKVYLIEGHAIGKVKSLIRGGFQELAKKYGLDGKITQVMAVGHGESTVIEFAGGGTEVTEDGGKTSIDQKDVVPIELEGTNASVFALFFEQIFANMEEKKGLKPKVLLRACLSASNEVDENKLKELMKKENILDLDAVVDTKTAENQEKIREGIRKYIEKHGSLATKLNDQAKGRAEVLGAQSSITSVDTGAIKEDTGELDFITLADPHVAGPKLTYVRHGKEPSGALRAVIESWANDPVTCFAEMQDRIDTVLVNSHAEFIINLLYHTLLTQYKSDILTANKFTKTAHVLMGVLEGKDGCRSARLAADDMSKKHRDAFYPLLITHITQFGNDARPKLVIYQDWMLHDDTKRNNFMAMLGIPGCTRTIVDKYLDFALIKDSVETLVKMTAAPMKARVLLALCGLIRQNPIESCKTFLLTQVNGDNSLKKSITDELDGYSVSKLRDKLDLEEEIAQPDSTAAHPKNVGGEGEFHVKPIKTKVEKIKKSTRKNQAKSRIEPRQDAKVALTLTQKKNYHIVGEVVNTDDTKTGWYMLRLSAGKIAYIEQKYFSN